MHDDEIRCFCILLVGIPATYALLKDIDTNDRSLNNDERHNAPLPVKDGVDNDTDYTIIPSSQPSITLTDQPTEIPLCTLDEFGDFFGTETASDRVFSQESVYVQFAYEVVAFGVNLTDLIEPISSALGKEVLSSMFNECPSIDVSNQVRILVSDDVSDSLTGFTNNPEGVVDVTGCAQSPTTEKQCIFVRDQFTLYTNSNDVSVKSILLERALASVEQSMKEGNRALYINPRIDQISYIDLEQFDVIRSEKVTLNEKENEGSGAVAGLAAGGVAVVVALALLIRKRHKSREHGMSFDDGVDLEQAEDDDFSMDCINKNLDFGFDEYGNAIHNQSNRTKNVRLVECLTLEETDEEKVTTIRKEISEDNNLSADISLNQYPMESASQLYLYMCPTNNIA